VFVPMFLLTGVARYLFVPMAEAVVFAMLASFVLSRTLVPTLAKYWLKLHHAKHDDAGANWLQRFQKRFEARFEQFRARYHETLIAAMRGRRVFLPVFLAATLLSLALVPALGQNFFPSIDAGQMKLHVRAPAGTRVEETAVLVDLFEAAIRRVFHAVELASVVDIIGMPSSGINITYSNSGTIGTGDADILLALADGHRPTDDYMRELRQRLPEEFPGTTFSFLPADIVSQILNFGLPAPIDVQVSGSSPENRELANRILQDMRAIPGLVDLRIQQQFNQPELRVVTDRSRAEQLGFTQRDVASNLLITLSGSLQTSPTFWLNPQTGSQYGIVTQTPQRQLTSLQDLQNIPINANGSAQLLGGLATIQRGFGSSVVSKVDAQPVINIFGAVQDRDLGSVGREIERLVAKESEHLPKGTRVIVRGQLQTMVSSYTGLLIGLVGAIVLVYLLIVVNFQSWLDPFIIITALPAAIAGIAWMLFITGTTLSVPALTGAIMCMGVATANSILLVSFARERLDAGASARQAALDAGFTRFRPVLMTALAMVIGMLPMALGLGEGGEQNAPLGRAVIGGLVLATVATLLFVPTVFSLLHGRRLDKAAAVQGAPNEVL
jgi:multidrug efflux pump subunit AcrB